MMFDNLNRRITSTVENNKKLSLYRKYVKKYILHLAKKTSFITSVLTEMYLLGGTFSIFD